jgi:dihydrofolate synthase / folylpolyglutamate synthase
MNYDESVRYLLSLGKELAAPLHARAQKFDLHNIRVLAGHLQDPYRRYPCAHVAGTNGKGSTAAMLASMVHAAGRTAGLYTSPHLERMNERIRVDGAPISDEEFAAAFTRITAATEELLAAGTLTAHPTYFECVTAMAFDVFARRHVDLAVFEVGLGGRLDSTNIVVPEVAIITQVDLDHEDYLGHSVAQIAAEKAGIIKPGSWVVSAAEHPEAAAVIAQRCAEQGARLVEVDSYWRVTRIESDAGLYRATISGASATGEIRVELPLAGRFQLRNAMTAAAAGRVLSERGFPLDDAAIARGIAAVRWPGRLEQLSTHPCVYLDGAHNPAGARSLLCSWNEDFAGRRILLVYGAMRDKAVDEIAGILFPRAEAVIFTEVRQARAISANLLAEMTGHLARHYEIVADPAEALECALQMAAPEDIVFVAGSLYLAGDLRGYWRTRTVPGARLRQSLLSTRRKYIST